MSELARSDTSVFAEWRRTVDWPSLTACAILLGLGLLLSLAAGPAAAAKLNIDNAFYYPIRHAFFVVVAGSIVLLFSGLSVDWARRVGIGIFLLGFLIMCVVFLTGHEAKGSQRWIILAGQTFQPSEIAKPGLVVLAAWILSQRDSDPTTRWLWIAFGFYCATVGLLLLQPDIGQTILLSAAFLATFFVAGLPVRWALGFLAGGTVMGTLVYSTIPYVRGRINSFLWPDDNDTYQVDLAMDAIERGGMWGVGPGEGAIKTTLPDAHTDFIYAVAVEEYGFIAALILIGLIAFIALRGLQLAMQGETLFRRAAATGLFTLFGLQAVINIGVNTSLLPPKGMTLPFVSYGGSSMIGIAVTIGLAHAIIRRHRVNTNRWRTAHGAA